MTDRKAEILERLFAAQRRRVVRRRAARGLGAAALLVVAGVVATMPWKQARPPELARDPGSREELVAAPAAGRPSIVVVVGGGPDWIRVDQAPAVRAASIDDEELSGWLAQVGREPGVVRVGGRVVLAAEVEAGVRTP